MYVAQTRPTTLFIHVCVAVLSVVVLWACSSEAPQPSRTQEAYTLLDSARNEQHRGRLHEAALLMSSIRRIPQNQLSDEFKTAFDHTLAGFLFDAQAYESCLELITGCIGPLTAEGLPSPGTALLIAHTLKKLGDTSLAIEWYRLAEVQISSEVVADINRNLAWLFAAQLEYDSAWTRYHRSRALSEQRETSDINGQAWWHFITGRLQLGTGRLNAAYTEIDNGLAILENLRISLQRSEVAVRQSILKAVEVDVLRHTNAQGRWNSVLKRIEVIKGDDSEKLVRAGNDSSMIASNAFSQIQPFSLGESERRTYPMTTFYMVTDAVVDRRGWLWLATLDGMYLMCGSSMIPVRDTSQSSRGPIRSITATDSCFYLTRFNSRIDTVLQSSIAPQDSSSELPVLRRFSWNRISSPHGTPISAARMRDSDSILLTYPSGYTVTGALDRLPQTTLVPIAPSEPLRLVTSVASLTSDSILLGTTQGLWRLTRSTNTLSMFAPEANRGLFESIENILVLPSGHIALSSSAVYTAVLQRGDFNNALWSGEEANALVELATSMKNNAPLLFCIQRIRAQRAQIDFDRVPPRLRNQIVGSRTWRPSRATTILTDSIACFAFPGHIAIADASTSSVNLAPLPLEDEQFEPNTPRVFKLTDSSILVTREASAFEGRLTPAAPREGLTMIACRGLNSSDFSVLSDGGTLHLPSDQRTIVIATARPRSYGAIDIPTIGYASWMTQPHEVQLGTAYTFSGLQPGLNTITFRSTDIPYAATLRIIVDPTLTETWWFWAILGVVVIALGVLLALYVRQIARLRRAELERTAMMERVKIGQDLHDAVGADLVRITMILNRPDDVPRKELARIAREANRTLRDIIWTSSAPQTADAVLAQIVERIRTIAVEAGLELDLDIVNEIAPHPMQASLIRDLVLIVTECITNIIKHARATVVRAHVTFFESKLHIVLRDNGIGFDINASYQGMGLPGMRQRAERSGILLTIRSVQNTGTEVKLIVSLEGVS